MKAYNTSDGSPFKSPFANLECYHGNIKADCPLCVEEESEEVVEQAQYEIVRVFRSAFPGRCTIDSEHKFRRDEKVGLVQLADNPFIPISGVACPACVSWYPKAKK